MTALPWHDTDAVKPPLGRVVLGWWAPITISAVVLRKGNEWFRPGYVTSERRTPPVYWTELPEPPLPDAKAE
jgi:hypothetical protein